MKMELKDDIVLRKNKDGSLIMMKMDESSVFYKVNGVAAEILNKLKAGKSLDDIISSVLDEYDIGRPTLEKDINELIDKMKRIDFIY